MADDGFSGDAASRIAWVWYELSSRGLGRDRLAFFFDEMVPIDIMVAAVHPSSLDDLAERLRHMLAVVRWADEGGPPWHEGENMIADDACARWLNART